MKNHINLLSLCLFCLLNLFSTNAQIIDLSLSLDAYNNSDAGGVATFEINVNNELGFDAANGVQAAFVIPSEFTFYSFIASQGSYDETNGIWTIGNLASGNTANLKIFVAANQVSSYSGELVAEIVNADEVDIDSFPDNDDGNQSEDDEDNVDFTLECGGLTGIKLQMNTTNKNLVLGDTATISIFISAWGVVSNMAIECLLPGELTFVSANVPANTSNYDPITGIWYVYGLNSSNRKLEIKAVLNSDIEDFIKVSAQVKESLTCYPNASPGNDDGDQSELDEVQLFFNINCTNNASLRLCLEQQHYFDTFSQGDTISFELTVKNYQGITENLIVECQLPSELTFVDVSPAAYNYDAQSGLWDIGTMNINETNVMIINTIVNSSIENTFKVTAQVKSTSTCITDSTPGNDDGDQSELDEDFTYFSIYDEPIDLELNISINSPYPNLGDTVRCFVFLKNESDYTATGIEVGLLFSNLNLPFSFTPDAGIYDTNSNIWSIDTLAANSYLYLEFFMVYDFPDGIGYFTEIFAEVIAANEIDRDSTPNNHSWGEDDFDSAEIFGPPYQNDCFFAPVTDHSLTADSIYRFAEVGDTVLLTLNLNNLYYRAENVSVELTYEDDLSIISTYTTSGNYIDSLNIWVVDSIEAAQDEQLFIEVLVESNFNSATSIIAELKASDSCDFDSEPDNFYELNNEDDELVFWIYEGNSASTNRVYAKVFLEAYHNGVITEPHTLASNGFNLIPLQQPFNIAPWNYNGAESVSQIPDDVVDWILLACRDINGNVLEYKAGFINIHGLLVDETGALGIELNNPNNYFSLHQKGHLAVMSNEAYGNGLFDFTLTDSLVVGLEQVKSELNTFVMYAGDFDNNGIINNLDFNAWITNNAAINQYLHYDVDGNGIVNNLDYNFWELNRSKVGALEIQY